MSKSAKSVFIYGIFYAINGLMLLFMPNVLLDSLGIDNTNEVWIRLAGILLSAISVYYFIAAKHELIVIMKATAFIRFTIIFFFTAFVLLELVSSSIIVISVIDFLGGTWTFLMLKKEGHFKRDTKN
jgi:isoprenylcysteine carboxyl methyltransferase (ICMT) family protein YpbQ